MAKKVGFDYSIIPTGNFPITYAKYIDFDGTALDEFLEHVGADIPQYTMAEYLDIKDTIEPGTAFIITDDASEAKYYIESPETAEVGQLLAVKTVDENGKPLEWEVVDASASADIPAYTQAEYNEIKDTIAPGTKFIITDDAGGGGGGEIPTAAEIKYSNIDSGLKSKNVQRAIDELKTNIDAANTEIGETSSEVAESKVKIEEIETELGGTKSKVEEIETDLSETKSKTEELETSKISVPQVAEVGQVLSVKAVDKDGRPVAWETISQSNGSAGGIALYSSVSAIPYSFYYGSAVTLNDDIYIIGSSDSNYYRYFCRFNGTGFDTLTNVPYDFYQGAAVVYNNEIHVLGGTGSTTNHYRWNGTSWSYAGGLPYAFRYGSAVVYKGKIHLLGGGTTSARIYHYEWDGISWSRSVDLPYYFLYGSAVVYNDEIHLLGSSHNSSTYTYHYKWDGTSWSSVSTLPFSFYQSSAVVANGKIHILGSPAAITSRAEWNGTLWRTYVDIPAFYRGGAVAIGKSIYLVGGSGNTTMFGFMIPDKNGKYKNGTFSYIQFAE